MKKHSRCSLTLEKISFWDKTLIFREKILLIGKNSENSLAHDTLFMTHLIKRKTLFLYKENSWMTSPSVLRGKTFEHFESKNSLDLSLIF